MRNNDNAISKMSALERFISGIIFLVLLIFTIASIYVLVKVFPSMYMSENKKLSDSYYEYYVAQYTYVESYAEKVMMTNQTLDEISLPRDICYQYTVEDGASHVIFYFFNEEEIYVEYEKDSESQKIIKISHRMDKEELHEAVEQVLNTYRGLFVIISICAMFSIVYLVLFLWECGKYLLTTFEPI